MPVSDSAAKKCRPLPPPDQLAKLVSNVTETMLRITFLPSNEAPPPVPLTWRMAVLPTTGAHSLGIGLSSDEPGCRTLGAAMFGVAASEVDESMLDDALRELVNMTAGVVKGLVDPDAALGLPTVHRNGQAPGVELTAQSTVLRAKDLGLVLWIYEA
ncbi:MAG: chemotaxis protein CheX [Myxococcales bacterium]